MLSVPIILLHLPSQESTSSSSLNFNTSPNLWIFFTPLLTSNLPILVPFDYVEKKWQTIENILLTWEQKNSWLTEWSIENARWVSLIILMAFSFSSAEQRDWAEKSSIEQSIGIPLNKMSITDAVKNGVVGWNMLVNAFIAVSSKGFLSRWTAINPPYGEWWKKNTQTIKYRFWWNLSCMRNFNYFFYSLKNFFWCQLIEISAQRH